MLLDPLQPHHTTTSRLYSPKRAAVAVWQPADLETPSPRPPLVRPPLPPNPPPTSPPPRRAVDAGWCKVLVPGVNMLRGCKWHDVAQAAARQRPWMLTGRNLSFRCISVSEHFDLRSPSRLALLHLGEAPRPSPSTPSLDDITPTIAPSGQQ